MTPASTTDVRLRDRAIARALPIMPKGLVHRLSAPYIAGERLDQAIATVQQLAAANMSTTVDVLGEAITHRDQAEATRDAYLDLIGELSRLDNPDLRNVSVKLTALGLGIDDDLMYENVQAIVEAANDCNGFVRVDMEDSPWTDATFELYRALIADGHTNVGIVVQSYLKRTLADVEQLASEGARVRVVKGIYIESERIAYREMTQINQSFIDCCRVLGEAGCHAAYATHDDELIRRCADLVSELDIPPSQYEYQMLLGVREDRRDEVLYAGHPMRVYVPFGAQWYEYSLRRLRENPRVAGQVASGILRSWTRRRPS